MAPLAVAIIGAGPAGFYTAEALLDRIEAVQIDILERLPTPFGLIRAGVAPDHQSTKQVARRFEDTALRERVHFYGNVDVGHSITLDDLRGMYDAVVLAVGAGVDRPLGIPGEQLQGVYGSALFVGWYNGHPDFRELNPRLSVDAAVVIGNGNVALDVARVLVKSADEMVASDLPDEVGRAIGSGGIRDVYVVGRRGAADSRFSAAELRELAGLSECSVIVDDADLVDHTTVEDSKQRRQRDKTLAIFRDFRATVSAGKPKRLHFRFHLAPVAIEGRDAVDAVRFERTRFDERGTLAGTGSFERIACGLVIPAVGYRSVPLAEVPFDRVRGLFPNDDGRIAPGLYAVGWAKRGPSGVIGSNRPDGQRCAEQIEADCAQAPAARAESRAADAARPGRTALERRLRERGVRAVSFNDWRTIDAAERARATGPAPRRKFTSLAEMLSLLVEESEALAHSRMHG